MVEATGWGKPSDSCGSISDVLREVTVPVMSNEDCDAVYEIVNDGHICIDSKGGKGTCNVIHYILNIDVAMWHAIIWFIWKFRVTLVVHWQPAVAAHLLVWPHLEQLQDVKLDTQMLSAEWATSEIGLDQKLEFKYQYLEEMNKIL